MGVFIGSIFPVRSDSGFVLGVFFEKAGGMVLDAQIKKGVLEMCLLQKLSVQDYYGYHLMREMKVLFPEVNDSTFYAILRRLHKDGSAIVYDSDKSAGPRRKYYQITPAGRKKLEQKICDWNRLKQIAGQLGI